MLIAFDLDGVLFDAKEIHYEALNMALRNLGHPEILWSDHLTIYDGLPTVEKLKILGVDDPAVDPLKQNYTALLLAHHSAPDRRVADILAGLRTDGHTVACVSNARLRTVNMILANRGLTAGIDIVVSAEHCRRPKPNPEPYLRAMIAAGIGPSDTVAVEDSDYGAASAETAGARVVRVEGPSDITREILCVPA